MGGKGSGKALPNPARQFVRYDRPPNRIREFRTKAGLTQQQLADRSGVTRETIAHLEQQDRSAKGNTIKLLSDVLGVDEDVLSGERKEESWVEVADRQPERSDYYLAAMVTQLMRSKVRSYSVVWYEKQTGHWMETKPDGGLTGRLVNVSAWTLIPDDPW